MLLINGGELLVVFEALSQLLLGLFIICSALLDFLDLEGFLFVFEYLDISVFVFDQSLEQLDFFSFAFKF